MLGLTGMTLALAAPGPKAVTSPASPAPPSRSAVKSPAASSPRPRFSPDELAVKAETLLQKNCLTCHGELKQSGLDLRTMAARLKGGSRGTALVPGHAEKSLLYRVTAQKEAPAMPPGAPLPPEEVAILKAWIDSLPPDAKPDAWEKPAAAVPAPVNFWPARPPQRVPVPKVKNAAWVKSPVDAFVLHRLEAEGLSPAPPADRRTLLRRAYFDLIGLPPSPEAMEAFVNDPDPRAFEKAVDRLLAMPQYGERWGRHWLDLVRYAESNGYERDGPKANAWKYRDYVIESFNADKPFDRFLTEQLAGDELDSPTNESRIATGFYRLGLWDDEPGDHLLDRYDQLDDVIKTTTNVFLGLTVNCARCHDHKFDPISQKDYTRLLAFFEPSRLGTEPYPNGQHKQEQSQIPLAEPDEIERHKKSTAEADARIAEAKTAVEAFRVGIKKRLVEERKAKLSAAERSALDTPADRRTDAQKSLAEQVAKTVTPSDEEVSRALTSDGDSKLVELRRRLAEAESAKPPPLPTTLGITDAGPDAPKTRLFLRGNPREPAEEVDPGFPTLLAAAYNPPVKSPPPGARTTGRRLHLARWLADPRNPQTARVMVNRIWQHHFGEGIVRTPNDFGAMGEKPTHPELLDWLAHDFMANGWRMKRLHRMILLSAAWQQSSRWREDAAVKDPENKLLWRMNVRRLEAEPIRDAALAVSGKINLQRGGPSIYPALPPKDITGEAYPGNGWGKSEGDQLYRRTVYVFVKRSLLVPMLEAFDQADPTSVCPQRNRTTVAPQALAMMNNAFIREQAAHFAERVRKEAGESPPAQVERAFMLALGRLPAPAERAKSLAFVERQQRHLGDSKTDPSREALADLCHALFNLSEFIYLD
ncbi:MAG: DUF1553 domain-containing protein [Armatimonadetes bacterium]|nr:DUF1553 domain-containing protein [Armatimonadota bacterium]